VRKVLWTCAEIGLDYTQEQWGAGFRSPEEAGFRALNPNAMVPVIQDDGFVLWESNTICRYLAGKHARHDLLPDQPRRRAEVEKWMDWQATELNNSWRYVFMARVRNSPQHTDAQAIAAGEANWHRHMAILDAHLAGGEGYAAGAQFTLADVVLGLSVNRWYMTPMERPALPAVAAYYERLSQRTGYQQHGRNGLP
jgi:glutathione S-transferase